MVNRAKTQRTLMLLNEFENSCGMKTRSTVIVERSGFLNPNWLFVVAYMGCSCLVFVW